MADSKVVGVDSVVGVPIRAEGDDEFPFSTDPVPLAIGFGQNCFDLLHHQRHGQNSQSEKALQLK